jgi:hypothetical protein
VHDSRRCVQGPQGSVPVQAFFFALQASQARVTFRNLRASLAISDHQKRSGRFNVANPLENRKSVTMLLFWLFGVFSAFPRFPDT